MLPDKSISKAPSAEAILPNRYIIEMAAHLEEPHYILLQHATAHGHGDIRSKAGTSL